MQTFPATRFRSLEIALTACKACEQKLVLHSLCDIVGCARCAVLSCAAIIMSVCMVLSFVVSCAMSLVMSLSANECVYVLELEHPCYKIAAYMYISQQYFVASLQS